MLRPIVMLTFRPEATAAEILEVRAPVCGDTVFQGPNHHDFAMVADFDDMAAVRRYTASAAHRACFEGPARADARCAAIQHEA